MRESYKEGVENLMIYQLSYKLMLEIHKETLHFPKIEQYGGIADQLRRSSKGITANIVEGFGKQHFFKGEFQRMLVYAIGSTDETILWIKASRDLDYLSKAKANYYLSEYYKLVKKLSTFTKNMKR